eukprot:6293665-Amphidinium_carterae.1
MLHVVAVALHWVRTRQQCRLECPPHNAVELSLCSELDSLCDDGEGESGQQCCAVHQGTITLREFADNIEDIRRFGIVAAVVWVT